MPTLQSLVDTARQALKATSESPGLDAEVLLCHVLNKPRSHLRAWPGLKLTENQRQAFHGLLEQRLAGSPIAYLTGTREFWSREFSVSPDVLIPRPDTECLIEHCLALIPTGSPCKLADMGTGSGIIAITMAAERPLAHIIACDISPNAITVARANALRHHVNNVQFYCGDWFSALPPQRFDLIASNPPYVAADDPHLLHGDVRFEPVSALVANDQGLAAIATLAAAAPEWLKPNGHLVVEHGYDQEEAVQAIFGRYGYQQVATFRDLSGQPRITCGNLP